MQDKPIAWMRKWHYDGEVPAKVKNESNRWVWPQKFKFLPVTANQVFPDDIPLSSADTLGFLNSKIAEQKEEIDRLRSLLEKNDEPHTQFAESIEANCLSSTSAFEQAASLVDVLGKAKTKGEMLIHILSYRNSILKEVK